VWSDSGGTNGDGFAGRWFDKWGNLLADEFRVASGAGAATRTARVSAIPDGEFVVAYAAPAGTGGEQIVTQRFTLQRPTVLDVKVGADGKTLVVAYSQQMATSGAGSVTAAANWALRLTDGRYVAQADPTIQGIDPRATFEQFGQVTFGFNATTKQWEATLPLNFTLTSGNYKLIARSSQQDAAGRRLDGDGNGPPSEDHSIELFIPYEVTVVPSGGGMNISEAGASETYTIALKSVPTAVVEITVTADAQSQVSVDGVIFAASVKFNRSDTTAQTITVRAIDDVLDEGTIHTSTIGHAITSSGDPNYPLSLSIDNVFANITDNDDLQASVLDVVILEGDSGETLVEVPIRLNGPAPAVAWISIVTRNGTATYEDADYVPWPEAPYFYFEEGATSGTLTLVIRGDQRYEGDETFQVEFVSAGGLGFADKLGVVTIVNDDPISGDYNANGAVDAADFVLWRNSQGAAVAPFSGADGSGNGLVDQADYGVWRASFGRTNQVPALLGDYNLSGTVDAADYVAWRNTKGSTVVAYSGADGDGDGVVNENDYGVWRANFGNTAVGAGSTGQGAGSGEFATANLRQGAGGGMIATTALAQPVALGEELRVESLGSRADEGTTNSIAAGEVGEQDPHPLATDTARQYPLRPLSATAVLRLATASLRPGGEVVFGKPAAHATQPPAEPGAVGVRVASTSRENHALRPRLRDVPPDVRGGGSGPGGSRQDAVAMLRSSTVARRDEALVAWLASRSPDAWDELPAGDFSDLRGESDHDAAASNSFDEALDLAFESLGVW
jgi:hypothetical protein